MIVSEEAIEQEHRDFLRKIANEVYELVRDHTNMACFRSRVKLFCEKNEEHQKEVKLLEKASSVDSKLHKAIKKKEKEIWGKTWEEMTEEERNNCIPPDISFYTRKLKVDKHYVYHEHLKDIDDNNCYHYDYFWGLPVKTAGLLEFLTTPPRRLDDFEEYYWDFEFSPQPDDDEKTICCYALLVAVHDIQILERPIFTAKNYDGAWELSNKWKNILWKVCTGSTWSAIPSIRIEGLKNIRAWILRSHRDVKADLAGIGQAETDEETMTGIEILQEQFKAAANKYPGLEHTLEDRLTEDCDPAVSSVAADRRMYKLYKRWNNKEKSVKYTPWSMFGLHGLSASGVPVNIRPANEKGYPKEHYLHRSPHQQWDARAAVDLFLLRSEEAGKLLIPLPELEGLWVTDPAEYWLLALHRVFPGLKLKEACELTEDELEMAAGGSYLNSLHPRKGDEYFEVLDDVFTKSALLCGKLLEIVKDLPKHLPREPKADCTKNENRQQKPTETDSHAGIVAELKNKQLTGEDQQLFLDIEVDIKTYPQEYQQAGKWLDEYYSLENFWQRKEAHLKMLYWQKKSAEDESRLFCPDELRIEYLLWSIMTEVKIFRPISELSYLCETKGDIAGTEVIYCREDLESGEVEEKVKAKLEPYGGGERDGVGIEYRLLDAYNDLLRLRCGEFISIDQARRACLITWLITDPDADAANLGLTKFEKWPWENLAYGGKDSGEPDRADAITLIHDNKDAWIKLVRRAWAKLEVEKTVKGTESAERSGKTKFSKKPKTEAWEQITIEVVDKDTIKYKGNDKKKWERVNYTELGFLDKRNNKANILWPVFLGLASKNLPSNIKRPKIEPKDIDRIRDTLRKFFGIKEGLPIKYNRRAKEYRCNFKFNDPRDWTDILQNENLDD